MGPPATVVAAALVLVGAIAEAAAAAQQPATYGGGTLASASPPKRYQPTVGVSLQPRGDRIAVRFDTSVLCGRDTFDVVGRRVVPLNRGAFSARGASVKRIEGGRLEFAWKLSGGLTSAGAFGDLHVVGVRRVFGRKRTCAAKPDRPFEAHAAGPPAGGPARPEPRGLYAGTSTYQIVDRLQAPVILRASNDARKVAARWTIGAKCRRGPRQQFVNLTPASRVRADGTFGRTERFSVRSTDALVRYRASFAGRFATEGATGTLRLRARVYNRRGTRLRTRCDSGRRTWNAATATDGGTSSP